MIVEKQHRKAAMAAYRERKTVAGIFAIRCQPTGQCWVGQAPDLGTIQNRIWFSLRQGSHRQRSLQAAWHACGAEAFSFTEIERIAEETVAYARERILKERLARWCVDLKAESL